MCAGLAAGGMRPYFAVYSSFFQRCHDQMIHDVCMQHLPVVFLLDRSGIGGEDGQTHHGVFDFASLLPVPGMTVLAPCDADELCAMLSWTIRQDGPVAIRYAKDGCTIQEKIRKTGLFAPGKWETLLPGKDIVLLAAGSMVKHALQVSESLKKQRLEAEVVNCSSIKTLDVDYLRAMNYSVPFFTLEEHMLTGGFGEYVTEKCKMLGRPVPNECIAIPDRFIAHGSHDLLMQDAGLAAEQITNRILK